MRPFSAMRSSVSSDNVTMTMHTRVPDDQHRAA